jgi:hypothetical protein
MGFLTVVHLTCISYPGRCEAPSIGFMSPIGGTLASHVKFSMAFPGLDRIAHSVHSLLRLTAIRFWCGPSRQANAGLEAVASCTVHVPFHAAASASALIALYAKIGNPPKLSLYPVSTMGWSHSLYSHARKIRSSRLLNDLLPTNCLALVPAIVPSWLSLTSQVLNL